MEAYPLCQRFSVVKIIPHPTERCGHSYGEISCAIDVLGEIIYCRGVFPEQWWRWEDKDLEDYVSDVKHFWMPANRVECECKDIGDRSCENYWCKHACICFRLAGIRRDYPPAILDRLEEHLAFLLAISPLPQPIREAVWAEFMPATPEMKYTVHGGFPHLSSLSEILQDESEHREYLQFYWIPLMEKLPPRNIHPTEYASKLYCTEGGYKILCDAASFFAVLVKI
jgi:hypothetical protein